MARAEAGQRTPRQRALGYRNGLIGALLAARSLRLRNFVALGLDRHLRREGAGWRLLIPAVESKTVRPLEQPFPEALVPALERYLAEPRPVLAARSPVAPQTLWLSAKGKPLHAVTLGHYVAALTRAAFGRPLSPHLFRDAAATSVALEDRRPGARPW